VFGIAAVIGVKGKMNLDDELLDELLDRLQAAGGCDALELNNLRIFLEQMDELVSNEDEDAVSEVFADSEEDFSLVLNDAEWRGNRIGPKATQCLELLDLVDKHLTKFNENIEVILATNPFISPALMERLSQSRFRWEEDGTTQTLARNTENELVLRQLANLDDNSTRYAVAANLHTPSDVLAQLAHDVDVSDSIWFSGSVLNSFIQTAVVGNPRTSPEILTAFASGELNFSLEDFENSHGSQLLTEQDLFDLSMYLAETARTRLSDSA